MAYTLDFSVVLGSSSTGLTLKAQLVDSAGSDVDGEVTTGFSEIGAGNYLWSGSIPDGHQGGVVFKNVSGGAVLAFSDINPPQSVTIDPDSFATALSEVMIESGVNLPQAIAIIGAAVAGKLTIVPTGTPGQSTVTIKNMDGTTTRIVAIVNTVGERLTVTLTPP